MTTEEKMNVALHEAQCALDKGELPIGAAAFLGNELLYSCHTSEIEDRKLLVHAELKTLQVIDSMGIPFQKRGDIVVSKTIDTRYKRFELFYFPLIDVSGCLYCIVYR